MFKFQIQKQSKKTLARQGIIETSHGKVQTPVFMPCATVGAVKGISPEELKNLGFELILANTYHLYLRPGDKFIKKFGGLHQFMNWPNSILTDSGGYQVFSLGAGFRASNKQKSLVEQRKDGVIFRSHLDGSKHKFTPEKVIDIQRNLGSDIMMVLDECTEYPASKERAQKSLSLTHLWAKKANDYWQKKKTQKQARLQCSERSDGGQALFGIIQGSVYQDLRRESAKFIASLPFDGIAVGGVSVGETKLQMHQVMQWLGPMLPKDKPHYLMGVGEPEDIIEAVRWGFDLFDSVLPTRLGRHGTVWVTGDWRSFQKFDLRRAKFSQDKNVLMKNCQCPACCQGFSRAYLSHLTREKEMLGMRLLSLHNLFFIQELLRRLCQEI